ncbi:MAG: hypothetical protein HQ513_17925 [Rhodospirillales bacterium]|nr:hypothetical protein [Rhodospirillales bacterium]
MLGRMNVRMSASTAAGAGRSAMVCRPGAALSTIGIELTAMAMVPVPPGISGLPARRMSDAPVISIQSPVWRYWIRRR